jgi:hypothetical protein
MAAVTAWDAPRSAASALLLTRLGEEHGVDARVALRGTGLDLDALRSPGTEITGRQELAVIRNLRRAPLHRTWAWTSRWRRARATT